MSIVSQAKISGIWIHNSGYGSYITFPWNWN